MKKLICVFLLFVLLIVLAVPNTMAAQLKSPYDLGYLTLHADVPDGFDRNIRVAVTDSSGNSSMYEMQGKDRYTLTIGLKDGEYSLFASVANDTANEYIVLLSQSEITLSQELTVSLTVTKLPGAAEPTEPLSTDHSSIPTIPTDPISPTVPTVPTEPTTATTPSTAPGAPEGEGSGEGEGTPTNSSGVNDPTTPDTKPDTGSDVSQEGSFSWGDTIISLLGTAAFVGIAFLCAYFFRKYKDRF